MAVQEHVCILCTAVSSPSSSSMLPSIWARKPSECGDFLTLKAAGMPYYITVTTLYALYAVHINKYVSNNILDDG